MTDSSDFRDLSGLATALKGALALYVVTVVIGLWSGWLEIGLLQRAAEGALVSETEAEANDGRQAIIGGLYILIFLVTSIMFLRWTYLSNRNARSLGADGLTCTPGWAVGWYFVPIANLWKPYQALEETFKASHPEFTSDWRQAQRPTIMPVWWVLWLVGMFVGQVVFRAALRAETIEQLLASSWLTFAADVVELPLGIAAIALVTHLQAWQSEKRRRVAHGAWHEAVVD